MVVWVFGWLIVGLLVALIGQLVAKGGRDPLMLLFGLAGAVIGGFLVRFPSQNDVAGLVGAAVGAVIVVAIGTTQTRRRRMT